MTYRELLAELQKLNDDQLDCNLTVELGLSEECLPAELRICADNHFALDDWYPVIFVQDI